MNNCARNLEPQNLENKKASACLKEPASIETGTTLGPKPETLHKRTLAWILKDISLIKGLY
jgi:hypothetical protein